MTKPRIIILMHYLELGGAEMALVGLLNAIDTRKYSVDLFLNQHTGPYMNLIPEGINLLPEIKQYAALERPLSYCIKNGSWLLAIRKIIRNLKFRRYLHANPGCEASASHFYMDCDITHLPSLHYLGEYDLAISFLDPPHIAQDKVLAKKKIEWIHTDFSAITYDKVLTHDRWSRNDYIISISNDISKSFTSVFPDLKNKLRIIENIISPQFVRKRAEEVISLELPKSELKIVSVGRINAVPKNFKIIPKIVSLLKARGVSVKWLIVGPGDKAELNELIGRYTVEEEVILVGSQNNPYPFIKWCDIYVQPSLFEGKSIAVREAQILYKPVIITNYPTSGSQIKNGIDGIICDMGEENIANAIYNLYKDSGKRNEIARYLSSHDYGQVDEVNKLYELI